MSGAILLANRTPAPFLLQVGLFAMIYYVSISTAAAALIWLGDYEFKSDNINRATVYFGASAILTQAAFSAVNPTTRIRIAKCNAVAGQFRKAVEILDKAETAAIVEGDFATACHAAECGWHIPIARKRINWINRGLSNAAALPPAERSGWQMRFLSHHVEELGYLPSHHADIVNFDIGPTSIEDSLRVQVARLTLETMEPTVNIGSHITEQEWEKLQQRATTKANNLAAVVKAARISSMTKAELFDALSTCSMVNTSVRNAYEKDAYDYSRAALGNDSVLTAVREFKYLKNNENISTDQANARFMHIVDTEAKHLSELDDDHAIWEQISIAVSPFETHDKADLHWLSYWYCRANELQKKMTGKASIEAGVLLFHAGAFDEARQILEEVGEQCLKDGPKDEYDDNGPMAFYDLAQILTYQNRTTEAKDAYMNAIRLIPERSSQYKTGALFTDACNFLQEMGYPNLAASSLAKWEPSEENAFNQNLIRVESLCRSNKPKFEVAERAGEALAEPTASGVVALLSGKNKFAYDILTKAARTKLIEGDDESFANLVLTKMNLSIACTRLGKFDSAVNRANEGLKLLQGQENRMPSLYAALLNCEAVTDWSRANVDWSKQNKTSALITSQIYLDRAIRLLKRNGLEHGLVGNIVRRNIDRIKTHGTTVAHLEDAPMFNACRRSLPEKPDRFQLTMDESFRAVELF